MEDSKSKIIEQLQLAITELDARVSSNNRLFNGSMFTWEQLCDIGIDLFKQLKQTNKE